MAKSARARSTCAAGALSERLRRVSFWRSSAVSGRRGSFRWRDMAHLGARGSPHHYTSSHGRRPTSGMRCSSPPQLVLSERCRTITNAQGERMSGAHGHGHVEGNNKKIALLIAVLALCLALAETMAKGAQTSALSYNVEASNLWAFFQAKTIGQTVVRTAGEMADLDRARNTDPAVADAVA